MGFLVACQLIIDSVQELMTSQIDAFLARSATWQTNEIIKMLRMLWLCVCVCVCVWWTDEWVNTERRHRKGDQTGPNIIFAMLISKYSYQVRPSVCPPVRLSIEVRVSVSLTQVLQVCVGAEKTKVKERRETKLQWKQLSVLQSIRLVDQLANTLSIVIFIK